MVSFPVFSLVGLLLGFCYGGNQTLVTVIDSLYCRVRAEGGDIETLIMRRKSMDVVIYGKGDNDALYLCLEPSSRGENFEGCMQELFV